MALLDSLHEVDVILDFHVDSCDDFVVSFVDEFRIISNSIDDELNHAMSQRVSRLL